MGETLCYVLYTMSCIPLCNPVKWLLGPKKLKLSGGAKSDSVTERQGLAACSVSANRPAQVFWFKQMVCITCGK